MIMTKLALALGLYAQRAHLDDPTLAALRRVNVASKAHSRAQERFRTNLLDQITDTVQDPRPEEAAQAAERVARRFSGIDEAFRKVERRGE